MQKWEGGGGVQRKGGKRLGVRSRKGRSRGQRKKGARERAEQEQEKGGGVQEGGGRKKRVNEGGRVGKSTQKTDVTKLSGCREGLGGGYLPRPVASADYWSCCYCFFFTWLRTSKS